MNVEAETYVLKVARRVAQETNGDLDLFPVAFMRELYKDPTFQAAAISLVDSEEKLAKLARAAKVLCDIAAGRESMP